MLILGSVGYTENISLVNLVDPKYHDKVAYSNLVLVPPRHNTQSIEETLPPIFFKIPFATFSRGE
jgi:hypothetical protein